MHCLLDGSPLELARLILPPLLGLQGTKQHHTNGLQPQRLSTYTATKQSACVGTVQAP